MYVLGLAHGGATPVRRWFLVASGGTGASVAPDLPVCFETPTAWGGLDEVHAFLVSGRRVYSACLAPHIVFLVG